jgi:hypothetical protein
MNRYMRKPYRCNVCFKSFATEAQAKKHWFGEHEIDALLAKVKPSKEEG